MKKAERKSKKSVASVSWNVEHCDKFESRSNLAVEGDPVVSEEGREPGCSPLEFEIFIPWVCRQWSVPTSVVITPKLQEDFRRKSKLHQMSKQDVSDHLEEPKIPESISSKKPMEDLVPVTAYYDTKQRLVEIAIEGSAIRVSRKVIAAFGLCVPYHSSLIRFTYRRSRLTAALINEINKLLPISNISEIVFDDSYVPEANYYILLEQISQLKYLSLNRCKINDVVCKKIFENIKVDGPAANSLQILELGSNDITDDAAIFIASVLRANRSLLHLNLSGNKITDSGFVPILDCLMEFPLNCKEKYDSRRRKLKYFQSKTAVYERCLNNLKCGNTDDFDSDISIPHHPSRCTVSKSSKIAMKRVRSKVKKSIRSLEEEAEIMTKGIIGEFHDPFSSDDVVVKNEASYSKGNFVLCYINVAYNNLENLSVQRLRDVMRYQDDMHVKIQSGKGRTGLMKITLDGNHIPTNCSSLLEEINFYLEKVIFLRTTGNKKLMFRKSLTDFSATHREFMKKNSSHKNIKEK